jgi:hypothetical protein
MFCIPKPETGQDTTLRNFGTGNNVFGSAGNLQQDMSADGDAALYASTALPASVESAWTGMEASSGAAPALNESGAQWNTKSSRPRPQSASRAVPSSAQRGVAQVYLSTDDAMLGQNPRRPFVQDDDEDCTFKPKIRPLPAHYGALKDEAIPIDQRFQKWTQEKELNAKARRDDALTMQLDGCTFRPKINHSSRRAMDISRADDERPVPERLYTDAKVAREELEEYKESLREQAEEEFQRQCTFRPKTNTTRFKAEPKYNEPRSTSAPPRQRTESDASEDGTFTPKTNAIDPKMNAARAYCQENVFDRLSRNATQADDDRSIASTDANVSVRGRTTNVMDMSEFMSALQGGTGRYAGQNSTSFDNGPKDAAGRRQRPSSATSRRSFDTNSSVRIDAHPSTPRGTSSARDSASPAQAKKFQEFLHRQQTSQMKRSKNRDRLEKQTTPSFKPSICPKSKDMHTRNSRATFLERVESEAARRERAKVRNEAKASNQPECTFKPELTAKAQKVKARSVVEMTRDSQKIETKRVRRISFDFEVNDSTQPNITLTAMFLLPEAHEVPVRERTASKIPFQTNRTSKVS